MHEDNEPIGMDDIDETLISEVATVIRTLNLQHGVPWARAIGDLVLASFFHGDPKLYRSKGRKHVSLRALAKRRDIGMSRQTLSRVIGVAVLCRGLTDEVAGELELQQGYALLQVPAEKQVSAAERAVEERLDPDAIEAEYVAPKPTKKAKAAAFGTSLRSAKQHISALGKSAVTWALTAKPEKREATRQELLALRGEIDATLASFPQPAAPTASAETSPAP